MARSTFPCHCTTEEVEDDGGTGSDRIATADSQHCAGALIMLEHLEQPSQMMRIAERLGFYDYKKLDMTSPVFEDIGDFIEHHTEY